MTGKLLFKITDVFLCLLSISLALGAINPFNPIVADQDDIVNNGFTSLFLGMFLLLSLFNISTYKKKKAIVPYSRVLLLFFLTILFSSIIYNFNTAALYQTYLLKLFVAILSFIVFVLYFSANKRSLELSMKCYLYTCVLIILLYFLGFLENYSYVSNGRLVIFGENSNSFSTRMGLAFIFSIYFIRNSTAIKGLLKAVLFLCALMLYIYIYLSGSRGTFIAVSLCVFFVFLKFIRSHLRVFLFLFFVLFLPFIYFSDYEKQSSNNFSMVERLEELKEGNIREELMRNAFNIFIDNPLLGVGVNGYEKEKEIRNYSSLDSHSIATTILAISGLIGFSLFFAFLFFLFREVLRKRVSIFPFLIAAFMLFISLKTGGVLSYFLMWYTYGISLAMSYNLKETFNIAVK